MSAEETSIKADLEAAFERHSAEQAQEEGRPVQDSQESVRDSSQGQEPAARAEGAAEESVTDGSGRDEKGRFKGKPADAAAQPPVEGVKPTDTQPPKEEGQQTQQQEALTAPAGWKAGPREQWAKIPRAAQEEIHRREKETAQTLRQSAQARQLANDFQQVVNPFMHFIQAQNSNPLAAVKNLMTTAAGLTTGSQVQKAQIVREIIQNYGIDISTLDQVLSGQPIQQGQQGAQPVGQQAPPPWAQPIFQFMQGVQQTRQQRDQQMIADAESETQAFAAKNEFFEDVREDMADIMEMSAKRGVNMTLQQAYDKAIALSPELAPIVSQRKAAAKAQQTTIQRNRNAASSVTGAPRNGPTGAQGGGDSRRSALEEAWDAQSGR